MSDQPIRFTDHATRQAERRGLSPDDVLAVVRSPEQVVPVREFRQATTEGGRALIRVLVDMTDEDVVVVTMYQTSKVSKYLRP